MRVYDNIGTKLNISEEFPYLPWQFYIVAVCGIVATIGGVLDWRFHRNPLNLQLSKKERDAEAAALNCGAFKKFPEVLPAQ